MGERVFNYNRLACGLFAALLSQISYAQNDISQALIERGQFWQARDDSKRAAEAWNKLLEVNPDSAQALYGLATLDIRAMRIDSAKRYLERLKQAAPESALVPQLEQDISLASDKNKALLEQARQAVGSSDFESAVKKYEQIFQDKQPVGTAARDYYSLLGYTPGGVEEAIENLTRLQKSLPNDPQLAYALAHHLSRNEETRVKGIEELAQLSENNQIGNEATESWRDALIWLSPTQPDAGKLYEAFLKKYPGDTKIEELLKESQTAASQQNSPGPEARPDPLRQRANAAMKQIEAGNTSQARLEFEAILAKRPNDSEALGGLGVLAMQQGNWNQALDYLTRARRGNAAWQPSLNMARYWVNVEQAQAAFDAGDLSQARRLATQATRLAPREVAANVVLGDVLLEEGKTAQAMSAYQAILKRKPDDPQALFGLSRATRLSGNSAEAGKLLEQAIKANPNNPWVKYEQAIAYRNDGRYQDAQKIINDLVKANPDDPQVLYISALLDSESQNWNRSLQTLDQIPADARSAPMNELYATANRQIQIRDAVALARSGKKAEAVKWLEQIQRDAGDNFSVTNAVAKAYVDVGEANRGLALLNPIRNESGQRGIDASIAYAGLLIAAGQDVDASLMLRQLQDTNLTASQREQVNSLADSYRIKQADQLTTKGDYAAAYDLLEPVLKRRPDDPGAQGALARMYAAAGQPEKARAIYDELLAAKPDNPQAHLGMALLAQQMGDDREASLQAEKAVDLAPDDRQVLVSAANISRDSGRTGDAVALLERALALETPETQPTSPPDDKSADASGNPFRAQAKPAVASASALAQELERLYEQRSAQVRAGVEFRSRSGESGTSQLSEVQTPLEVNFPVGNGRGSVRVTPVTLDAGSITVPAYTGPTSLTQYSPLGVNDSRQSGVGLSVGYSLRGMELDAGVTPIGFLQTNFTGGALFTGSLDSARTVGYRLDISSRPVTDSMLSFAGRRYDSLGLEWGGVMATGARLTISKDFGTTGIYGSAAWHSLQGKNVASNQRSEFNVGLYSRIIEQADSLLMAGINVNATFYQKNLNYFTYGSGGYFSPQEYYALAFPITWAKRYGQFNFRIDGALGLQSIRQAQSPIFPNNPELQSLAQQLAGTNNLFGNGFYQGQSKTGVSYNFRAAAEYWLNPSFVLGGTIGANNAEDFREWSGGLYLRYFFYPQRNRLPDLVVEPYRSPFSTTFGR